MFQLSARRFCPECYSQEVRKSSRWGFFEKYFLPLLLMRPFRCEICNSRYVGFLFAHRDSEAKAANVSSGNPERAARARSKAIQSGQQTAQLAAHHKLD